MHAVASAEEALRILADAEIAPQILVSDVGMPGIDGYELIRRIRGSNEPAQQRLPAIAVTAYANHEDRVRALPPATSSTWRNRLTRPAWRTRLPLCWCDSVLVDFSVCISAMS